MELSNYNVFLYHNGYTAVYNFLNGAFVIMKGYISEKSLKQCVCQKNIDKNENVVRELLKKRIINTQPYTREEEIDTYENYYIITNSSIFYQWEDEGLLFLIPGMKKEIKLDKKASEIWLNFSKSYKIVKDVKEDLIYLVTHFPNVPLLCLRESGKTNSDIKFVNRYIMNFHEKEKSIQETIDSIYLKLTNYCNLNCKMCGQAQNRVLLNKNIKCSLNFDAICKFVEPIIDELKYIYLWGGEPLLHTQWKEFALYFSKHKKYVSIATNGTLLNENMSAILETKINELIVSLDGPETIHNDIRNSNKAFCNIVSGIEAINRMKLTKQALPKIIINCTITEDNIYSLYDLLNICLKLNVNEVVFQLPIWVSREMGERYEKLCYEEWKIYANSWKGFEKKYIMDLEYLFDFIFFCKTTYPGFVKIFNSNIDNKEKLSKYFESEAKVTNICVCDVINNTIVVEADGEIVTCPDFPDIRLGNIENMTYKEYTCNNIKNMFKLKFYENKGYSICSRCCHNLHIDRI